MPVHAAVAARTNASRFSIGAVGGTSQPEERTTFRNGASAAASSRVRASTSCGDSATNTAEGSRLPQTTTSGGVLARAAGRSIGAPKW